MIDEKKFMEFMTALEDAGAEHVSFDDLRKFVDDFPKIGGWIPCSERLPEEYGDYLVTFGFNDVSVKVVDVSSYSENGFEFINVIAWQPLPEEYHG